MDNPDQLRADLEHLYESIENGWTRFGRGIEAYGAGGGCLGLKMCSVLQDLPFRERLDRYQAMYRVLGFRPPPAEFDCRTYVQLDDGFKVDATDVARWNDHPDRTWDEVKDRVKDTIGKL